jgi:hypothetical protein
MPSFRGRSFSVTDDAIVIRVQFVRPANRQGGVVRKSTFLRRVIIEPSGPMVSQGRMEIGLGIILAAGPLIAPGFEGS